MNTIRVIYITVMAVSLLTGCASYQYPVEIVPKRASAPNLVHRAPSVALSEKPSLDEYILYALRESAELEASYNTYRATVLKAPQVSALPDPKLSYAYFLDSIETRVGPMRQKVGLAQPIPLVWKASVKRRHCKCRSESSFSLISYEKEQIGF